MGLTLVTGATGFIGRCVVKQLVAEGRAVRCLVRPTSQVNRINDLPVEIAVGDLAEEKSLQEAMNGCRQVIHLAGISAWSELDSPKVVPTIVAGTQNVLSAAVSQKVARVVFVSSTAAMGPSRLPHPRTETAPFDEYSATGMIYVLAKREAERCCLDASEKGLQTIIVRPAEVYGPGDDDMITAGNLVDLINSKPVLICRGGTSIVHLHDAASGIIRAMDCGENRQIYSLGGENLHHHELARMLLDITGRSTTIITIPSAALKFGAKVASKMRIPFPISPGVVPYATRYWCIDNQKSRRDLGMSFRSARETLTDTVNWLKTQGKV